MLIFFEIIKFRIDRAMRCVAPALAVVLVLASHAAGATAGSGHERQVDQARGQGLALVSRLDTLAPEQIDGMTLSWQARMDCRLNIQLWMSVVIRLSRTADGMMATLHLTEPEGKDAWSWLLLKLVGRHTREYRSLVKGIEVRIQERFHREGDRFVTDSMEETIPEKLRYPNQTAIRVRFLHEAGLIAFWPDKRAETYSKSMPLADQVGPLTAFFNYVFFTPPKTRLRIINALKQVVDDPGNPSHKQVSYLFESETADLGANRSGVRKDFSWALYLKKGNLLDILYGNHIFYRLAESPSSPAKIPDVVHFEGIISKNRKARRLLALQKKYPGKKITGAMLFQKVDDILAAKNVHGYFTGFDIQVAGAPGPTPENGGP
jgi:hypothetical protein